MDDVSLPMSTRRRSYLGWRRSKYQSRGLSESDWATFLSSREVSMYAEYEYITESARALEPEDSMARRESQWDLKYSLSKSGKVFERLSPIDLRIWRL